MGFTIHFGATDGDITLLGISTHIGVTHGIEEEISGLTEMAFIIPIGITDFISQDFSTTNTKIEIDDM
jgi:hypothetical protein